MSREILITYSTSASSWPLIATESNNVLWAKIRACYAKLVPSCYISTLLKALPLTLYLFSDTWLYDHVVTSYIAMILWTDVELWKLFLRKFTFTEKSDLLQKFYTTKIWSHTVLYLFQARFQDSSAVIMVCLALFSTV